jgi:hypothetical protein
MTAAFDSEELNRLNQTPTERLLDWAEENFKHHDYGPKRGRAVGYELMSAHEDELYTFAQGLTQEDQNEIGQALRTLEGQCRLLELVLEMIEPGYETEKQVLERIDMNKKTPKKEE